MSIERDNAIAVLAYRRGLADAAAASDRMARANDHADRVEQIAQLVGACRVSRVRQLLNHFAALLKRGVGAARRMLIGGDHVADHKQLQGFKAGVNAGGHSGSPDDADDVAGHPAMTATTANSPHRLSETPE